MSSQSLTFRTVNRRVNTEMSGPRTTTLGPAVRQLTPRSTGVAGDYEARVIALLESIDRQLGILVAHASQPPHPLLAVVHQSHPGRSFEASELIIWAASDSRLKEQLEAFGIRTAKDLGQLLKKLSKQPTGQLVVRKLKRNGPGGLWSVGVVGVDVC